MQLPNLSFLKKKVDEEFLISLIFKPKNLVAVLLSNKEGSITIISTKSVSLDLLSSSTEELISAADEAISSLELSVDDGNKIEKTLFAVPYSWTDDEGNIKKDVLVQLKKISVELALKPMGFIVTIEALIKFFQDKEGVPLTAIFVEEAKNRVYLYMVKNGTIVEVHSGEITSDVEKAVEHTLKKVEKFDRLPSRMILLYHEDIDERQQNFLNFPWTKDLPFLHLPQISLMEKGFENEAVVDAIASQLNARVAGKAHIVGSEILEGEASNMDENENFGFVKEKDISEINEIPAEREEPVINNSDNLKEIESPARNSEKERGENGLVEALIAIPLGLISRIKIPKSGGKLKTLFIPVVAVVVFIILMALYYVLILRAEVTVFLAGETLKDEVLVALSEEDETSFDDKLLHIDTIEQEVEGEISTETTGTEEVGENAKGEVTILSSLNKETTISSGTIITSSNGLKFKIDNDVKIASSSGVSDIKSVKAKVTADEFGKEYNLPSNTKFSVSGFDSSSVEAKNETAFAGGTKEEKRIVSEEDITNLEAELTDNLFEKAVDEARKNIGDDEEIISVLLDSTLDNEKYSAKAGDEAESIELTGKVFYTLGVYRKEEAEKFINDAREDDAPEDLVLSEEDSEIRLTEIEESKNGITGKLTYEVVYKPEGEFENIANEIGGKTVDSATDLIKSKKGVSDVNIIFLNKLPLLPPVLPVRAGQIEVKIETEGA